MLNSIRLQDSRETWVPGSIMPCVTVDKSFGLPELQLPPLEMGCHSFEDNRNLEVMVMVGTSCCPQGELPEVFKVMEVQGGGGAGHAGGSTCQ